MTIRPYQPSDADALLIIFRKNVPQAFGEEEVSDYAEFLQTLNLPYFVAEQDGRVMGTCGYYIPADNEPAQRGFVRIVWIFSDPDTKGLGVGSALLTYCLAAIRQQAPDRPIECRTSQVAYRFFERFGFQVQYTKPDYWVPGLDLIYMVKGLQ